MSHKPAPIRMRAAAEIPPPAPPSARAAARHLAIEAAHVRLRAVEEEIAELEEMPDDDEGEDAPLFSTWLKDRGIEELTMEQLDQQLALFLAEAYPDLFTTEPADDAPADE